MYNIKIGHKVIEFDRIDSTNAKFKELLKLENLPEGTTIWAHNQIAGRGYAANSWESEAGKNITVSILLRPDFLHPSDQFWLTKILSLAIRDTIDRFVNGSGKIADVFIKWPNDIYINDLKIAGMLIENSIMGETIKESICGIGININQEIFRSDPPNPVSIKMLTHKDVSRRAVLDVIFEYISKWYKELVNQQFSFIDRMYQQSLYRRGTKAKYESNGEIFFGTIKGTNTYGHLQIEIQSGIIREFDFKEVSFHW